MNFNFEIIEGHIVNLIFISKIPHGKKISTNKEFICIEEHTPLQGAMRWLSGDSRERAVKKISSIVYTALEFAQLLSESVFIANVPTRCEPIVPTRCERENTSDLWVSDFMSGSRSGAHLMSGSHHVETSTSSEKRCLLFAEANLQEIVESRINLLERIVAALVASLCGINNLCETYKDDFCVIGSLHHLCCDLNARIKRLADCAVKFRAYSHSDAKITNVLLGSQHVGTMVSLEEHSLPAEDFQNLHNLMREGVPLSSPLISQLPLKKQKKTQFEPIIIPNLAAKEEASSSAETYWQAVRENVRD